MASKSSGPEELPHDLPEDQVSAGQVGPSASADGTSGAVAGQPDKAGVKAENPSADELPDELAHELAQEDAAEPPANSASALTQAQPRHGDTGDPASAGAAGHGNAPVKSAPAQSHPPQSLDYAPANPLRRVALLVALVIVGVLLYVGEPILLPLSLSVLLTFLLSPLCDWLEHRRVPRVASVMIVGTGAFVILGVLGWAVFNGVQHLGDNIEQIESNLKKKAGRLPFNRGGGTIDDLQQAFEEVGETMDQAGGEGEVAAGDEEAVEEKDPASTTGPIGTTTRSASDQAPAELSRTDQLLLSVQQSIQAMLDERRSNEQAAMTNQRAATQAATQATTQPAPGQSVETPIFVTDVARPMTSRERAAYFLSVVAGPLGAAGLVVVFTLFILLQREDLRDRLITLAAGQQLNLATQALDDATTRISKYLIAQAIVNGTYGLAVGIGLEVIAYLVTGGHFPSVWLWALLCAALRFIPYLGPWLGAAFPIFVSLGFYDGYSMFVATAGFFVVIELLSNNVMEPILYGSTTGMSPVAVILAAAFWTFVWGPVGLLVATPLTTCLVVLGKHVPGLRFFYTLLGDEPVLSPDGRVYQRMLALDAEDAEDVVEEYRKDHTLTETFDRVLLPALALAERDRHAGNLTIERIDFIRIAMRELVEELAAQSEPNPADSVDLASKAEVQASAPAEGAALVPIVQASPGVTARVVVIPSVDAADRTAALMLKALLDRRGFDVVVVDEEELTSEKLEQVFAQRADVAVISAVPPRAVARARYLVKRIRQAQSQRGQSDAGTAAAMVVGLWTVQYDVKRAGGRVQQQGPELRVVTNLADAVEEVRQRAQVVATKRAAEPEPRKAIAPGHEASTPR